MSASSPSGTSTATTTSNASSAQPGTATTFVEPTADLVTADLYGIFVAIFFVVITIFVLFSTGSILAVLILWTVMALIVTVLFYYGFIDLEKILGVKKETKKKPVEPAGIPRGGPLVGQEVFHISQNKFTYDEAPAVCAAFGGQLATLEQVIEAYNSGAEWCGYGWTAGGLALYPTQKKTWEELQREVDPGKRTACGRPGVNGGYFDPTLKFGVNCFGFKPPGEFTPPAPIPGTNRTEFNKTVNKFKEMIKTLELSPFSRNEWSGYDSNIANKAWTQGRKLVEGFFGGGEGFANGAGYGTQFTVDIGKLAEGFENAAPETIEYGDNRAYNPNAPYGLRGPPGPTGPPGPPGAPVAAPASSAASTAASTPAAQAAAAVQAAVAAATQAATQAASSSASATQAAQAAASSGRSSLPAGQLPTASNPCGQLGRPNADGSSRLYTMSECVDGLMGIWSANGECSKISGGSWSYDCRSLNPAPSSSSSTSSSSSPPASSSTTTTTTAASTAAAAPAAPTFTAAQRPSATNPCGTLGTTIPDASGTPLRLYTRDECVSGMGGRWSPRAGQTTLGECTKLGAGGSFSWDCRTLA